MAMKAARLGRGLGASSHTVSVTSLRKIGLAVNANTLPRLAGLPVLASQGLGGSHAAMRLHSSASRDAKAAAVS